MDSEYWKKLYKDKWPAGVRRAEAIAKLVDSWGYDVHEFGFLANSTEYSKESPKEKGAPDWEVSKDSKIKVLLEVTGTEYSRGDDEVWIRPDKFDYAENHTETECWVGHIIENKKLIRFIKLENKDKYPIEVKKIRGVDERFRIIPDGDPALINSEDFKNYLEK